MSKLAWSYISVHIFVSRAAIFILQKRFCLQMKSTNISFLFFEDILPRTKVMKENTKSSNYKSLIANTKVLCLGCDAITCCGDDQYNQALQPSTWAILPGFDVTLSGLIGIQKHENLHWVFTQKGIGCLL